MMPTTTKQRIATKAKNIFKIIRTTISALWSEINKNLQRKFFTFENDSNLSHWNTHPCECNCSQPCCCKMALENLV